MTPAFKIPFPFLFSFFSFCVHQEDSRDQKVTHFNFVWPHFKKKKFFFLIKNKKTNLSFPWLLNKKLQPILLRQPDGGLDFLKGNTWD